MQHADARGPERLVARPGVEVRADRLHVDGHLRHRLGAIDQRHRAGGARLRDHLHHGVDRAEHVGHVRERHQRDVSARELCPQRLQRELAALVHLEVAQRGLALAAEDLPGHEVGVVLHLGDQHGVAAVHVGAAPRVGDEVDRLGDVLGEDRARRLGAGERRDAAARGVVGGVCLLRERVHAAVDVGVVQPQMVGERLDHGLWLLRGRGRVQVHQLASAEAPLEDGEVALDGERALSDLWHRPRCPRARRPACPRSCCARAPAAARPRARR